MILELSLIWNSITSLLFLPNSLKCWLGGMKAWRRRGSNDKKERKLKEKRWGWVREERESFQDTFSPHWFYNSSEGELWSYINSTADCTESAFKPKWESRRKSEQKVTWEESQETKISTFDTSNLIKNYISSPSPVSYSPHLFMAGFVFPFFIPVSTFQFSPSQCVFFSHPTSEFVTLCELSRTFYSE